MYSSKMQQSPFRAAHAASQSWPSADSCHLGVGGGELGSRRADAVHVQMEVEEAAVVCMDAADDELTGETEGTEGETENEEGARGE